jgi:hypothetical protein
MKIKVGQWVRMDNGMIYQITDIFWKDTRYFYSVISQYEVDITEEMENHFLGLTTNKQDGTYNWNFTITFNEWDNKIIKVADTPKELVQVGDLVEFEDGDIMFISRIDNNVITHSFNKMAFLRVTNRVTKIYTLDSNGNYIKQWERE